MQSSGIPNAQQYWSLPSEFPAQPLWQNLQLRRHLLQLSEHLSLLKAVREELQALETLKRSASIANPSPESCTAEPANPVPQIGELPVDFHRASTHGAHARPTLECPTEKTEESLNESSGSLMETEMQSSDQLSQTIGTQELFASGRGARILTAIREGGSNELHAREAAAGLQQQVRALLEPLQAALSGQGGWENAAAAARLANKQLKIQRNRRWRQRKRQKIGKALHKEREGYDEADQKADEWRAREIAKLIAKRKMEKMKEVAEKKAKEERTRLEEELEMVLMVEKLQELRALRIQKLKKQGRFLPDEDDKFMERVRAAVEEEERQAAAASDTSAAAAAIASAAEAGKSAGSLLAMDGDKDGVIPLETTHRDTSILVENSTEKKAESIGAAPPTEDNPAEDGQDVTKEDRKGALQEGYGGLPPELYHYYYGSHADMGTLIEVRRGWDAFIMPGGSRIPGHWIQAPPPADSVWASCLKRPKTDNKHLMDDRKLMYKTQRKRKK